MQLRISIMKYSAICVILVLAIGAGCGGISGHMFPRDQAPTLERSARVDVRAFGAAGDGKTDDTAAIQRAVNSGHGGVLFSPGRYRITRPITIELDRAGPISISGDGAATIIMAGPGPALHLIGTHQGSASPSTVEANVWERQRMPLVDAIEIVGEHPEAIGVRAEGTIQSTFSRLVIRRTKHAIHLTGRNRNVIISASHIYENSGVGIYLDKVNLHQINIADSHISYNKGGGIVVRASEVRNLQVGNSDIEGNMDVDGPPTANILIDATRGSVREGAIVGCTIQHTHRALGSANIRFIGREPPVKVGRFTIADNAISDASVNIHLQHARGVTISGNTLWKGVRHNLLVENSSHILVAANLFERNPDYGEAASNGLTFRDSEYSTLTGLHIQNTRSAKAGLVLERCRWFNISNLLIVDAENWGLLMEDVDHTRISDSSIRASVSDSGRGGAIRLTGGRGNMITDNRLIGRIEIAPGSATVDGNAIGG